MCVRLNGTALDILHFFSLNVFTELRISIQLLIFLSGRMGNNKEALHLIIEKEANVVKVWRVKHCVFNVVH
jgi:hypothetical protein